jgi:hypothetical protein
MPTEAKTEQKFGPALTPEGLLRPMPRLFAADDGTPPPVWIRVARAWNNMPAGIHLPGKLDEGLTADAAFAAEADRLEAFAATLRDHFARHYAMETELAMLRDQRRAVGEFFRDALNAATS